MSKLNSHHLFKISISTILSFSLFFLFSQIQAATHNIDIKKFTFSPAEITIDLGDTIRWNNKEKRQYHSVWFEEQGEPEPQYFFPDEFYEREFNKLGDFPYRCGPHPKMKGLVHVINSKLALPKQKKYVVESVEDGDTIVVQYKGKSQRVQLIGIDAPEDTQNPKLNLDSRVKKISKEILLDMGAQSTNFLKTLIKKGETVLLEGNLKQKDKYNRLPAIAITDSGQSLNEKMIESGYAILLTRFPLDSQLEASLKDFEKQAIKNKKGLWKTHDKNMKKWINH